MEDLKKRWIEAKTRADWGLDVTMLLGRVSEEPAGWNEDKLIKKYIPKNSEILDINSGRTGRLLERGRRTDPFDAETDDDQIWRRAYFGEPIKASGPDQADEAEKIEEMLPERDVFDAVLNKNIPADARRVNRILKPGGIYLLEQPGDKHNVDLIEKITGISKPAGDYVSLEQSIARHERAGFQVIYKAESFPKLKFYDIETMINYAHVMKEAFPPFDVESCYDRLLLLQEELWEYRRFFSTQHLMLLVLRK